MAHGASVDAWEEDQDPEFGGGIDGYLGEATWEAAALLRDVIWAARWTRRIRFRRRRKKLAGRVGQLNEGARQSIESARKLSFV